MKGKLKIYGIIAKIVAQVKIFKILKGEFVRSGQSGLKTMRCKGARGEKYVTSLGFGVAGHEMGTSLKIPITMEIMAAFEKAHSKVAQRL